MLEPGLHRLAVVTVEVLQKFLPCMALSVGSEKKRVAFLACAEKKLSDHVRGTNKDPKLAEQVKRDHPEWAFEYLRELCEKEAAMGGVADKAGGHAATTK